MNRIIYITALILVISSFTVKAEIEKEIDCASNTFLDEINDSIYDKNQDGIKDVFYEFLEDGSYFELNDSNYDGKVDQSCKYDANDTIVSCSFDQDFNGFMESKVEYHLGAPFKEGVDINGDGIYEIIFHYESGVLSKGFQFYSKKNGRNMIGKVSFKFVYPSTENLTETNL